MNFERRCQRIYQIGCLPCRKRGYFSQCQVQHLNFAGKAGQKRRGDRYTIGLCPWHHVGEPLGGAHDAAWCRKVLGPSYKLESTAFRETFGTDDELLAWEDELIEEAERRVIGRVPPLSEAGRLTE